MGDAQHARVYFQALIEAQSVKPVILGILICIAGFLIGCGGTAPDETAIDDPQTEPAPDGGEPVLSEEGP